MHGQACVAEICWIQLHGAATSLTRRDEEAHPPSPKTYIGQCVVRVMSLFGLVVGVVRSSSRFLSLFMKPSDAYGPNIGLQARISMHPNEPSRLHDLWECIKMANGLAARNAEEKVKTKPKS